MKKLLALLFLPFFLLGCPDGSPDQAPEPPPPPTIDDDDIIKDGPFKVLVFSRALTFRHPSIESGQQMMQNLGDANDFTADITEDHTVFTTENLANYEAVVFLNTTGDVLEEPQQQAFQAYIENGGGFVGIHSAADTEHGWEFYGNLVGAYFLTHPVANQPGTMIIEDGSHPTVDHVPEEWQILPVEEFYSFKTNPRENVRILARIDESSYDQEPNISCDPSSNSTFPEGGYSGSTGDHPMIWCHDVMVNDMPTGRAWYTALGHEVTMYQNPDFQAHVLKGVFTATKRIAAECSVLPKPDDAPEYTEPFQETCQNQLPLM